MAEPVPEWSASVADRYRIERELGRGGMATVYLAHDLRHDRPVALKVLHAELAQSLGPMRFQQEIRVAARLQHPHILTVLDSGESDGRLWFTMPFVEGESLRDRLLREKQLPLDDALQHRPRCGRRARLRPPAGHRPPRHQAREHSPHRRPALVADFGIARALDASRASKLTEHRHGGGDARPT